MADASRLDQQVRFILEIDKLKQVLRRTLVTDESRRENSAEHSWHLALCALVLAEYAPPSVDLGKVVRMVLVHDLVEIDAGDTFCHDPSAVAGSAERERAAAERLFSLLPAPQGQELRGLWEEFEARATPEARFATALDRLQPVLQNTKTRGGTWRLYRVRREQVLARMQPVREALPAAWPLVEQAIADAVEQGDLVE